MVAFIISRFFKIFKIFKIFNIVLYGGPNLHHPFHCAIFRAHTYSSPSILEDCHSAAPITRGTECLVDHEILLSTTS